MENSLVLTSMQKTSESPPQQESRTSEDVIREWVARFATNCGQTLSEARVLLWLDELGDIKPQRLEYASRAVMRAHAFNSIPQIGEIRAQIDGADAGGLELEAAASWEKYLTHVKRWFHPDIGWNRRAPHLSAVIEHCARAAGGPHWIECCPESDLQWARKRFIDAYKLVHETQRVEYLLRDGEAKNILRGLTAQTALPAPTALPPTEDTFTPEEGMQLCDEIRRAVAWAKEWKPPAPIPKQPEQATVVLLDEPTEQRRRAQLDALKKKYPEAFRGQPT